MGRVYNYGLSEYWLGENGLSENGLSENGMSENGPSENELSENELGDNGPNKNGPSGNVNDCLSGEAGVWAVDQDGVLWQRRGVGQHCPEGTMWASVCEVSSGSFVLFWRLRKWKTRG